MTYQDPEYMHSAAEPKLPRRGVPWSLSLNSIAMGRSPAPSTKPGTEVLGMEKVTFRMGGGSGTTVALLTFMSWMATKRSKHSSPWPCVTHICWEIASLLDATERTRRFCKFIPLPSWFDCKRQTHETVHAVLR